MAHALKRTSPKGGEFIGTCFNCGKENIPLSRANEKCKNWTGRTADETLLYAIKGANP